MDVDRIDLPVIDPSDPPDQGGLADLPGSSEATPGGELFRIHEELPWRVLPENHRRSGDRTGERSPARFIYTAEVAHAAEATPEGRIESSVSKEH